MKEGHVVKYRTKKFLQDRNLFMVDFQDVLTKKTLTFAMLSYAGLTVM